MSFNWLHGCSFDVFHGRLALYDNVDTLFSHVLVNYSYVSYVVLLATRLKVSYHYCVWNCRLNVWNAIMNQIAMRV